MTPFHMIETYLHIPDSKGCSSLFEAEMIRSKEYIDKIKNMDKNKFSFIVLDEIFSSTNYIEGFSGAYAILKKISSFKNTLSITTTHYSDLEILEKETNGKIKNYKFDVQYANNEIIFNYLLKKGSSRQYIALDLLKKNGFDDDIIENALTICNKIKNKKIF
jgi:DNA mismatch repair ATPase MutS